MKRHVSAFALLLCAFVAVGSALPVRAFNFYLFSNYESTFVDSVGSPGETTEELPTSPKSWSTESHLSIKANELEGYRFLGWYTKQAGWGTGDPTEVTAGDVDDRPFVATPEISGTQIQSAGKASGLCVIVAKYVKLHTLTLAVEPAGAGAVSTNQVSVKTIIVEDGGSVTLTATANAGWKFGKWNDGVTTNPRTISNVRAPSTYTAAFSAQFKTVTLEKCGGAGGTDSVVVTNGLALPKVTVPTRTGYDFKGYYTSETGDDATQYYTSGGQGARTWDANEETCALYARWEGKKFKVRFNNNGATSGPEPMDVTYGKNPGPLYIVPQKQDYQFTGYYLGEACYWNAAGEWTGGSEWTYIPPGGGDVIVTAHYAPDLYTVKFHGNGGVGEYPDANNVAVDAEFTLPDGKALSLERHVFAGWALSSEGQKVYDGGTPTTVLANRSAASQNPNMLTFYAVWTDLSRTVRFNAGSDEATVDPQEKQVTVGEPFGVLATAVWAGGRCTLAGWRDRAGVEITPASTVPEGAGVIDLTARWTTNGYTVVFHENGGTGGMGDQRVSFYETVSLAPNRFVRAGYQFAGWATNETDGVTYADGAEVRDLVSTKDEKVHLYAKWTANDYRVAFFGNGGTNEMAVQSFAYDVEQALTSNRFVREGFAFAGWATDPTNDVAYADGEKVENLTTKKDATVRLFAKWTAKGGEISKWSKALGCDNLDIEPTEEEGMTVAAGDSGVRIDVKKAKGQGVERGLEMQIGDPGTLTVEYSTEICEAPRDSLGRKAPELASFFKLVSQDVIYGVSNSISSATWKYTKGDARIEWIRLLLQTRHTDIGEDSDSDNDCANVLSVRWEPAVTNASWVGVTFRANDGTPSPDDIVTNVTRRAGEAYGTLPALADRGDGVKFRGWAQAAGATSVVTSDWIVPTDSAGTQLHAVWSVVTNAVPTAVPGLVYDGNAQTGVAGGVNYAIVGNVATNAGEHVATATVTNGVWEGGATGATNVVWTIAKATHDMGGVAFASASYEYDGKEHAIAVTGAPDGVEVVYTGDATNRTEVGTNTVTASFRVLDADNWNAIEKTLTATLAITAKDEPPPDPPEPVVTNAVPTAVPGLVYDGNAQTGVVGGVNYAIVGNVATNAGEHVATATVTNGVWEGGATGATNVVWTIAKATYDMSGVAFASASYEYDGKEHAIAVTGAPDGVEVVYSGDATNRTEVGTNTVTASFRVPDELNYNVIATQMTATLAITARPEPPPPPPPPPPPDPTVAYENIYFKATLAELGAEAVPTNRKITVRAEGLPKGLKLVTTPLKDAKKRATGFYAYTVEGVPTELLDGTNKVAYVRVTDNKVQTLYALGLRVLPAADRGTKAFPDGTNKVAYANFSVTNLWADAAANPKNWTFSGWPSGVRYATKDTARAGAFEVYGTPTKPGRFTVKAVEKIAGTSYKSTHVATFTVWPDAREAEAEWTNQAYVAVHRESGADVKSASGLPTGVKFAANDIVSRGEVTAQAHHFYGTPTKAGTYAVTLTHADTSKTGFLWTIEPAAAPAFELKLSETSVDPETSKATIRQGVAYAWAIDVTDGAAVTASGLPTGLKLVKTAVKEGKKTVGYMYSVSGVPTKAGEFFTTFTAKLNGVSTVTSAAFAVLDLPPWAQGTFDGGADEAFPAGGQVTFTVSKAGKLSGKWMSEGTNWTLTAASYDRYDDATASYVAQVVGKAGSGKSAVPVTNELAVAADGLGGVASNDLFLAWQNNWKTDPWNTIGGKIAKAPEFKFGPYADAGDDHTNDVISLKFAASGKVTVKASYFKSVSKTGRISWTTASGSAVLCPQALSSEDGVFPAAVFVYLPPKKNTPTEGAAYAVCVRLRWDGEKFVEWTGPE